MNRFEALQELLGHRVEVRKRKVNGSVTVFWAECSCGYTSSEFRNSSRTATGAAYGHLKRTTERLKREGHGVSLQENAAALLEDSSNVVSRA